MMNRANKILLIVLAVQLVAILVLDNPWSSGYYRDESPNRSESAVFPDFEADTAYSFMIDKGEQSVVLERAADAGNEWYVVSGGERFKAETSSVKTLLNSITRLEKMDVVSRNPEKASVYELDEGSAITLGVFDQAGEELVRLLVGKNLGALRGTYVKLPDEDDVYLQQENFRRCCDKGDDWFSSWRDKTVLSSDSCDVKLIEIRSGEQTVMMEHRTPETVEDNGAGDGAKPAEGAWWLTSPIKGKVMKWKGERMAEVFSSLKAQGFAEAGRNLENVGLADPEAVIVATLLPESGEKTIRLSLSGENEGARYMIVDDDSSTIYTVANFQFQLFLQKPEELLEEPLPDTDEGNEE